MKFKHGASRVKAEFPQHVVEQFLENIRRVDTLTFERALHKDANDERRNASEY